MVYLVRTCKMVGFDEEFDKLTSELFEHIGKTYPQVKEQKFLMGVTGPVNEIHWLLTFDSLADEEAWAAAIMKDELYRNWFPAASNVMTPFVDRMYRDFSM